MAGTHAKKGPSGAESLHGCAGKLALVDSLPPEQRRASTRASQLGTAAHFLLEKALSEQNAPETFEGRIIELIGENEDGTMLRVGAKLPTGANRVWFVVDDTMIEGVGVAFRYVRDRCTALGMSLKDLQLESRTNPLPDRDDTSGTADVTIDQWPDFLEVVDYKNGVGTVEHEDNPQLLAYLTGKAEDTLWSHDKYAVTVVQPNARHEQGKVRTFEVTAAVLRAFQAKHRAAAERSDEAQDAFPGRREAIEPKSAWAKEYLTAGGHCDWCDASMICPAKRLWLKSRAHLDFQDEPPSEMPTIVGAEEAAAVLEWKPHIQAHIKQAEAFLNQELRAGRPGGGAKLVRSTSRRMWRQADLEDIVQTLVRLDFLKEDDLLDIGTTEEAIVKAGFLNGNEIAQLYKPAERVTGPVAEKLVASKLRKAFNEAFLVKPPGKLTVVPASDSREAVTADPAADFAHDPYEEDD